MKSNSQNNFPSIFFILLTVALILIIFFFYNTIISQNKKSVTTGKPLPSFSLPSLFDSRITYTNRSLSGHVFLLNFWASWCKACQMEHDTLLKIANTHTPIYGIAYKDKTQNAKDWLKVAGNPYAISAIDSSGESAYKFALYGIPETFIVDKNGMIRYQHIGIIDQKDWETLIRPLIEKYENNITC